MMRLLLFILFFSLVLAPSYAMPMKILLHYSREYLDHLEALPPSHQDIIKYQKMFLRFRSLASFNEDQLTEELVSHLVHYAGLVNGLDDYSWRERWEDRLEYGYFHWQERAFSSWLLEENLDIQLIWHMLMLYRYHYVDNFKDANTLALAMMMIFDQEYPFFSQLINSVHPLLGDRFFILKARKQTFKYTWIYDSYLKSMRNIFYKQSFALPNYLLGWHCCSQRYLGDIFSGHISRKD